MKYYYTYVVILTKGSLKGKLYFGQHTTYNLNDGYKGSGAILKSYYKKYPKNYILIILNYYDNQDDLNLAEYNLIHPHLNKEYCLNIREGGYKPNHSDETKDKLRNASLEYFKDPEHRKQAGVKNKGRTPWNKGKQTPEETKQKQRHKHNVVNRKPCTEIHKQHLSDANKGKTRTLESRKKQSETTKGHRSYIKGKYKVYDDKEKNKYHFEY